MAAASASSAPRESIYNWIKVEAAVAAKPARYRSRFNPKAGPSYSTLRVAKKAVGSIGKSVKATVNPKQFLKAGSKMGKGVLPTDAAGDRKFGRPGPSQARKPALPKRTDRPIYGVKSSKDYVVANAVENILAAPPEPDVEPDYRHKEDYGKVPEYLADVKHEIEDEREMARAHIEEAEMMRSAGEPLMRELSADEREELLGALKAKWDIVNARYQKMTHQKISTHNSSLGQIRTKEQCEAQMDELERDIARLSVKGPIFVVDE